MAEVILKGICKIYLSRDKRHSEGVMAVKNFNMDIADNEFIVFVGPSGCGKSTTLRMIAGLEEISSGELYIDGLYMNDTEPKNRDISMVFQNYALYPHMTAYKNIAFGLTLRKIAEPVYSENEEASSKKLQIGQLNAESKQAFLQISSIDKKLSSLEKKLEQHKSYLKDVESEANELSDKKIKSTAIQTRLVKLNGLTNQLKQLVGELENEISKLKSQSAALKQTIDDNAIKTDFLRDELTAYRKFDIDKKQISKYKKNIAYYENLEVKDATRKNKNEQNIVTYQEQLNVNTRRMEEIGISNNASSQNQNELYKLQLKQEELNGKIEFCREELRILETRKKTIEKCKAESREKLEYFTKTPQPVYKYRHYTKYEIDRKVKIAADILDINGLLQRKPREMSGGQRQRIALGRAIVREPKVFLLDEPLSNLDAKLRATMRVEISRLHEKLKTTFIYVTHDQIEAMTMGTRIVVMKDGIIQQIDTPTNLFDYPDNVFVAGFIGTPQMNFFNVKVKTTPEQVHVTFADGYTAKYPKSKMRKLKEDYDDGNEHECILGVRGEHIRISGNGVSATVKDVEILGSETHLHLESENSDKELIVKSSERVFEENLKLKLDFDSDKIHLFDGQTQTTILQRI